MQYFLKLIHFILVILSVVISMSSQANLVQNQCILLGKNPSFIIKLKKSSIQSLSSEQQLQRLSTVKLTFNKIRYLSENNFLVFVKSPTSNQNLMASKPGCYDLENIKQIIVEIKQNKAIIDVMPNIMMRPYEFNSEEILINPIQWNLLESPGGIELKDAWQFLKNQKQSNVTVAVMDTGILAHQALDQNLLYVSFDGNTYKWINNPSNAEDAGISFTDNGENWMLGAAPSCKKCIAGIHGTHVTGIIASTGKMAYGETVYGIFPSSHILPINVFTKIEDPDICDGVKNTPCTISYAVDQLNAQSWLNGQNFYGLPPAPNVKVLNMSLGGIGICSRISQESFNHLLQKKISIVVAAGNSNIDAEQIYPASCPQVISVAATGPSGERAWYSNWGKSITIAAPGGNSLNPLLNTPNNQIYSTIAHAYKFLQGTSMASPMVAGVVALMYSVNSNLDSKQIKQIITKSANTTQFPAEEALLPSLISCVSKHNPEHLCGAGIINAKKVIHDLIKI
jgi:subtilisin family serine protease